MIRGLSYRYKLPLCIIFTSAVTAMAAVMVTSWQYYQESKNTLVSHSRELGYSMADMLATSIKFDDIWHAYSLLRGHKQNFPMEPERLFVVVDSKNQVFASNQPAAYPVGFDIIENHPRSSAVLSAIVNALQEPHGKEITTADYTVSSVPILSNNILVGSLVIVDSHRVFSAFFNEITSQGFLTILILMSLFAPAGWYWGKRMIIPLVHLESCVLRIGKEPLENVQCLVPHEHDEIGRLSQRFQQMLDDLKEKAKLEQQIIMADRLAAIGTLAAGVAHEINNPLSGMLIAIESYKKYCKSSDAALREKAGDSIALVERGLLQIKNIAANLLVNVKYNDRPLASVDIADVYQLLSPEFKYKSADVRWDSDLETPADVSSTMVRQILINLLLNAVHAIERNGRIFCTIKSQNNTLAINVKNDGKPIAQNNLQNLFAPYYSTNKKDGSGLGLWVTHQIIQQLGGTISVSADNEIMEFIITIPTANDHRGATDESIT